MTEAEKRANEKYCAKMYDKVVFRCAKGGLEYIKEQAKFKGMTQAEYIRYCIIEEQARRGHRQRAREALGLSYRGNHTGGG